ncbi:hypothetical protein ACX801_05730 [Arthrobacter bambusae]
MSPTPEEKNQLRRYTVYLDDSVLKGAFGTDPVAQIDSILSEELPRFIAEQRNSTDVGRVAVMFWTHGGNVLRSIAEREVLLHAPTWRKNGIYPIYFLWDTGALATMCDAIKEWFTSSPAIPTPKMMPLLRNPWGNWLIGALARLVDVPDIWTEMKEAASKSNDAVLGVNAQGGGYVFAKRLKAHWPNLEDDVELHAVGHSAGAIFHADFIPFLFQNHMRLESLQLLAPAIRIDEYTRFLQKMKGNSWSIGSTRMFTMNKTAEENDTILGLDGKGLYRGSLLYFIRNVLEYGTGAGPIDPRALLGLEQDYVQASNVVTDSFNQVVWTPAPKHPEPAPGASSQAQSHTEFSRDPDTLNSIATNILGTAPRFRFQ